MNNFKNNLSTWLKDNIDFALLLAVFTETPRWAVAFMAVNEPLWVGVPLGVLLAFATSHAWRAYFDTKNRGLLVFNIVSIVIAVAVIAPVLFAMTESQAHEIQIAAVLNSTTKAIWSTLLALTTFIPLVQLAAVKGLKDASAAEQSEQKPTVQRTRTTKVTRTDEQSETVTEPVHIEAPVLLIEQDDGLMMDVSELTIEQKREAVQAELLNNPKANRTKLAKRYEVGRTTLYSWISELQPTEANT